MNHPYDRIFTFATFLPLSSTERVYNMCELLVDIYPLKECDQVKTIRVTEKCDSSILVITPTIGDEITVIARKKFVI
jgi:hypothetical protein